MVGQRGAPVTKRRTGEPWKTVAEYGRTLSGLSLDLLVRDVAKIQLHADHTYDAMRDARLRDPEKGGLGAEIRFAVGVSR